MLKTEKAQAGTSLEQTQQMNWRRLLFSLSCLLFVAGALFASDGLWRAHTLKVQSAWPSVEARIGECRIESRHAFARSSGRVNYYTWCNFHYSLNGTQHVAATSTSSTVDPAMIARMRAWIAAHPPGLTQTLRYDPVNPTTISLAGADSDIQTQTSAVEFGVAGAMAFAALVFLLLSRFLRK